MNSEKVDGFAVVIPIEAVEEVSSRFVDTLYGYFIGKRLAFPLVENYVKNTWAKFGVKQVQLHEDFFLFQFETKEGMESVMEHGPWSIHLVPLMLNVWTQNTNLKKEDIKHALIWVKLHHVPIVAYSEVRAMIEVAAEEELKESIVIAIPMGMVNDSKQVVDNGFTVVQKKKARARQPNKQIAWISTWNIRGLNFSPKQSKVRYVISENNLSVCAVLESHASSDNLARLCASVFRHWSWTSNGRCCNKGTRIILGWNHNDVDIVVINQDDQAVHVRVWLKVECKELFCSFIYEHNKYTHRRLLWKSLCVHKLYVRDRPWCILGDFNTALFLEDFTSGMSSMDISMREFKKCVMDIKVMDVQRTGLQFTWNQKTKGKAGLLKKIDRIMANIGFTDEFVGSHAVFIPYRIFDHAPLVLNISVLARSKPKPFKFYNLVTHNEKFKDTVMNGWSEQVSGFSIFKVVQKMRHLKKPLQKLLFDKGNLHENVKQLRNKLDTVQARLDDDPFNVDIRDEEASTVAAFNEALLLQERFLKHKAKVSWLGEGGANTAYFHKAVKSRVSRSRIDVITSSDGTMFHNEQVANVFISHYEQFLGQPRETSSFSIDLLFNKRLNDDDASYMICTVTRQDIKNAISWPSRCAFKVDIQKVYDTVDWGFLREVLIGFGFHDRMVKWIMECVTTTSFSICIHASIHGYFKGKRGLRQGDPLSPYLFTLVMEIFTLIIKKRVRDTDLFAYHRYCSKLELVNLCFANDLFLFVHGDVDSFKVIKEALEEFKNASGLIPSLPKSTAYFCNVLNHVKLSILHILPFEEGRLPVKYLGVPLVSSRLMFRDCKELIEKVESRIIQGFLWRQGNMKKGRANVAWEVVCLPKDEGGLGLRQLDHFNKAHMVTHIWKLLSLKESLWVQWIHSYKLQVNSVWLAIRPRDVKVDWFDVVWFSNRIPQHAFNLWLIMKERLKMQDRVCSWDVSASLSTQCPLCDLQPDSHKHLFFECPFSRQVWNHMKCLADLDGTRPELSIIKPFAKRRSSKSVIAKLVLAACAYFIWQERNARLFKSQRRSVLQVIEGIIVSVRLKLVSCRFKRSRDGESFSRIWRLQEHSSCL
nr:hypothetical protein [Tanacetum cinerariifolium]